MTNVRICLLTVGAVVGAGWMVRAGIPPTTYDLSWHTVDGGGVMHSIGRDYKLSGAVGQHDAAVMNGRDYTLSGGLWFGLPPGDCSDDGLVNLLDHSVFHRCVRGPQNGPPEQDCLCFDVDRTGVVDMKDVATIQRSFTGP